MYIVSQKNWKHLTSWDAFEIINFFSEQISIDVEELQMSQKVLQHHSHNEMNELVKNI